MVRICWGEEQVPCIFCVKSHVCVHPHTPLKPQRAQISDELLYRWILDADDYGAALPDGNGNSDWVLGVEVKDASGAVEREATPGLRTTKRRARIFCVVFFVL